VVASELVWVGSHSRRPPPGRIEVWGNAPTLALIRAPNFEKGGVDRLEMDLREFKAGDHFTPQPAMKSGHARRSRRRRLCPAHPQSPRRQVIFYGHDSGLYPPEALERLSDGVVLDVALMDCRTAPCN